MHPAAQVLGRYQIVHQLGAGGMGAVYRAVHLDTGEEVALKTVLVAQSNELAAIRTEIQALRRLTHPGIVRILDAGIESGSPWYAMELLQGTTLQDFNRTFWSEWRAEAGQAGRLKPATDEGSADSDAATQTLQTGVAGPVTIGGRVMAGAPVAAGKLRDALTLAYRLCSPLSYLHQSGIVHRDLKPGNVFVRPDGRPVLMDFGLVSRFGAAGRDVLEIAGTLAGTAAYMAPEQILRQRVDARSDLYALGCIFFELLTGRPPFLADSVGDLLQRHLTEQPIPPSLVVSGVPASLDELILALLAKNVRERIGHADDVSAWLETLGAEPDAPVGTPAEGGPAYLYRPELSGRSDVLETLAAQVRRLFAGIGGCVLLGGESGVGKTSVVAEVARTAQLQQLTVVAGECQPIGGGVLHPLIPLLGTIVDRAVEGGPLETARLFGRRARVLAAIDPAVSRAPGYADIAEPQELPADAARARLLTDFRETVAAFAEERPILLVLDDLQWADALTLEFFLTTPAEFFERNALLVVGTYRSDEQSEALREILDRPNMTQIQLGRLETTAVGAMVGDMLALNDPPRGFVDFVATHSEGNPFFVAEYLRTAVAERLLKRTSGRWVFGDGAIEEATYAHLSVPASLRELVGRRLAGLPDAAQRVAQIAAVLGRESDAALLLTASGMLETDAMEAIRILGARQVLDRVEGGRYRFLHDKLRETAYAAIPANRRPELHRRAAESLERVYGGTDEFSRFHGSLAVHYETAGDRPRAIDYRDKAAEHAARAFADREVIDHLTSALRLDDEQGRKIDARRRNAWRTSVGIAHRALGELEEGRTQLEQSLAELGQPVPPKSMLGVAPYALRELTFRRALASPPVSPRASEPDAERALNAYNFIAMIAYHQSDVPAQLFSTFAALRLAPRVGPSSPAAQLYAAAGNVLGFLGFDRLAWRYAHLSHRIAEASGHELSVGIVHQYSGHLAAFLGEMATFDADIHCALDVYTRVGHHRFREEALTNIGHLQCLRGELVESLQTWREIERSARARADVQTTSWGMLGQARVTALMGGTDEGLQLFEVAILKARDDLSHIEHLGARALTFAHKGIDGRAREDIVSVLRLLEQSPSTSYTSIWAYSNAIEALFQIQPQTSRLSREDAALARRLIATFKKFVRMIRLARPRLQLWIGVLEWHLGRPHTARRAWTRALEGMRQIGLPFDEALAHFWIGRCSADADGAAHLAEAVRAFERMQARWYTNYSRRLLEERSSR